MLVIVSDQDHLETNRPALLKVHGCATRPATVRVTTEELTAPQVWVRDEVNVRLAGSHTVFVGIGDVPPYVRTRIEEANAAVGTGGAVFVVAPEIDDDWDDSPWAEVIPDLPTDRRIAATADQFLDDLASAYIRRTLRQTVEDLDGAPQAADAFNKSRDAFEARTSLDALRWLRRCAFPGAVGASVTREQAFSRVLIALGRLAGAETVDLLPRGQARAGEVVYEVLAATGNVTASKIRREAQTRLEEYRSVGRPTADLPTFLVAGAVGQLDHGPELPPDVLDASDGDDLIVGPLAVEPTLVRAEDHVP